MKAPSKRLIEGDDALAVLLRAANHEYGAGLDEQRAWHRHRQAAPRRRLRRIWLPSVALAAAAGLLALTGHFRARSPELLTQAEPEHLSSHRPSGALTRPSADAAQRLSPVRALPLNGARAEASSLTSAAAKAAARAHDPSDAVRSNLPEFPTPSEVPASNIAPSSAIAAAPAEPAMDCLAAARAGDAARAERCFEGQATGQNLAAEVALYELARLRRDMLGKPAAALAALDEYARRFPHGSLSGEVLFSRLELLVKAGNSSEVLRASDALLASVSGAERAAEIHLLRGNLYARSLGDPASAAHEYAQAASAPGAAGDEAAYLEGVNWQKAGEVTRARAVFERYLARSGARHTADVQARLAALPPASGEH